MFSPIVPPMFSPIVPPPTEHHGFSTGHSTENGDSAKTVVTKINAGFKHVYSVLAGMGASLADEVEYVAKSEFDALVHELEETKAELNNVKMMVQGLGFAGTRPEPKFRAITDPSHSMGFTHPADLMLGGTVGVVIPAEPVVTVTDKPTGITSETFLGSSEPVVTVSEETGQ